MLNGLINVTLLVRSAIRDSTCYDIDTTLWSYRPRLIPCLPLPTSCVKKFFVKNGKLFGFSEYVSLKHPSFNIVVLIQRPLSAKGHTKAFYESNQTDSSPTHIVYLREGTIPN